MLIEGVLLILIVVALMAIGVIADFSQSRLHYSEWRLKHPGYRQAIRRQ